MGGRDLRIFSEIADPIHPGGSLEHLPDKREGLLRQLTVLGVLMNSMFSKRLEMIQDFKLIVRDGINFTEPESNSRRMVQELLEFYEWFERRLPSLWKEWEEQRKNR